MGIVNWRQRRIGMDEGVQLGRRLSLLDSGATEEEEGILHRILYIFKGQTFI
jgi:hypothetical protein